MGLNIDNRNSFWTYKNEQIHNKFVSNKHFIFNVEQETADMHPATPSYLSYWKTQKRRCIEGYWHEGKWMPGNIYFYINFCKIKIVIGKSRLVSSPFLRDLEWEKGYVFQEARGFSGFRGDPTTTSLLDFEERGWGWKHKKTGETVPLKAERDGVDYALTHNKATWVHPRNYLRTVHPENYGKPLYENRAFNVIDIEARRLGKSYIVGNSIVLYNFLFNGATDYDEYLEQLKNGNIPTSETLVGAIDAKYTKDLLSKTQLGMDELRGGKDISGVWYPCPFFKKYRGSFAPSKYIEAAYIIKENGNWITKGCRSLIHNRSFGDNPLAGNGTGPNITCLEEVGFHYNLIDTLGAMKDTTMNDDRQFGTIYMLGTGGDMEGGSSEPARDVFFNPKEHGCLSFQNVWEESSTSETGFFVPYQFRMASCRDEEGVLDFKAASIETAAIKAKIKGNNALSKHIQNNPETPPDAFLTNNSNCFPTADINEHIKWLKSKQDTDAFIQGQKGSLIISGENSKITWKPNEKLIPAEYPVKKDKNGMLLNEGCVVIWEHPVRVDGEVPNFLYYAGNDPYDQDQASTSASLGSTFIYKTVSVEGGGITHSIVAEYTGRPERAKDHHENVRRLVEYYNAKLLYENNRNTIKFWFEQKHSLHRFVKAPNIVKSLESTKSNNKYGVTMTGQVKEDLLELAADWLTEERGDGKLNLHSIYSVPLLQELFYYNETGNFDRVIAFILTICNVRQHYKIKAQETKKDNRFLDDDFFKGSAFNN